MSSFDKTKILAVIFTCNHCPTAQYYEERIKPLVSDYREKGVAFVAISPNDPESVRPDEMGYTDLGDTLEEMKVRARDRAVQLSLPSWGRQVRADGKGLWAKGNTARVHL